MVARFAISAIDVGIHSAHDEHAPATKELAVADKWLECLLFVKAVKLCVSDDSCSYFARMLATNVSVVRTLGSVM